MAEGRQERSGTLYQVCMEGGLKVHPDETFFITFLGGEDIRNEVIMVKEPARVKDVEDIEHRRPISRLLWSG